MRILHVIHSAAFSGVERHVALLAAAQATAGHQVVVIGGERTAMRSAVGNDDVRLEPGESLRLVARHTHRYAPAADIVHAHMTASELAAGVVPGAWTRPFVSTRHFADRRGTGHLGAAAKLAAPLLANRLSAQIAVSRFVAERIDGTSVVVYAGVRSVPEPVPIARRKPVVLVAQRLQPEKRTDTAVQAFAQSGLAQNGWTLEVAGVGAQLAALRRLAVSLGVDHQVRFLGLSGDVAGLMSRAALLLAPRPDEAYGLSVLEAMAGGLPVVAAGAAGHLETLGLVEGAALFPACDAAAAGAQLARLADDSAERRRLASAQRAVQRTRFTLEAQQRATDAVYRSVL